MASPLAEAHIEGQRRLRVLVASAVTQIWRSLPGYDRPNLDEWLSRVVPLVLAGQRQSAALTEAYLARSLERQPLGINPAVLIGAAVRNGTAPETVYERPFVTLWTALKRGAQFEDALAQGLDRATSTAATDVQLSMTHTVASVSAADPMVSGFRRVTDGNACALCRIASTQRYHRGDLLPIHSHCGCGVLPIVGQPTGQVIDRDLLRQLKADGEVQKITAQRQRARAREESGIDEPAVHEHGELGPVLTNPAHDFTSISDI